MGNDELKQTKFDSMVTNKNMQLVKTIIPYIDNSFGNYLGVFIKMQELKNAAHIRTHPNVCATNADKPGMEQLLDELKDFMSNEELENIDMMMSVMEMMNMNDSEKQDMMNSYMDLFGM